jgi:Rifampin ADP-ribosyl transferase
MPDTPDQSAPRFYHGTKANLNRGDLIEPQPRQAERQEVAGEATDRDGRPRRFYHGTKADLQRGDLITPGHTPNFGARDRTTTYVYLTGTLDAATWGAELAVGDGPGRIYVVEPTGPIADDPDLTNSRYPGNPTKSYRSREPLRVTGEVTEWEGHAPEAIQAMEDGLERLRQQGVEPID